MKIQVDDYVELVLMPEDPDPIPVGTRGRVINITNTLWKARPVTQYIIEWENGRTLSPVSPPDVIRKIEENQDA